MPGLSQAGLTLPGGRCHTKTSLIVVYGSANWEWTRDVRARWLLEEADVEYEARLVDLRSGKTRTPEFLALHPLGQVPVLVDDDTKMIESGAILCYLAEKYAPWLVPALMTPKRAEYLQWFFFATVTLEPPAWKLLLNSYHRSDHEDAPRLVKEGRREFLKPARVLEKHLTRLDYVLGPEFSAADIMVGTTLVMADRADALTRYPTLKRYLGRLAERAPFRRAYEPRRGTTS